MKKTWKRLCTGFLALATVVTALPTTPVHAESKQYWTESAERVGIIEKVMNDGSIGSTFNEGYMKVEGETAYCIDINTDFKNGYKTRAGNMCMVAVTRTLPLIVADLFNGAMEKLVSPCRERHKHSMTLPNIFHFRRQRLGTWCFFILPIMLEVM